MKSRLSNKHVVYILPILAKSKNSLNSFICKNKWLINDARITVLVKSDQFFEFNWPLNFRFIYCEDVSIYDAWNQSLDYIYLNEIFSTYISFVGDDDVIDKSFFNEVMNRNDLESYDFIYGEAKFEAPDGRLHSIEVKEKLDVFSNEIIKTLAWGFSQPGSYHARNVFEEYRFSLSYRLAGDLEFYIRLGLEGKINSIKLNSLQVTTSLLGISNSPRSKLVYNREVKKIQNDYNLKIKMPPYVVELLKSLVLSSFLGNIIRKLWWKSRALINAIR